MFNVTVRNDHSAIAHNDVIRLGIGYRVVYLEFQEDGIKKIRAYGRKEFKAVDVEENGVVIGTYPLDGAAFQKLDFSFAPAEQPDPEQADTSAEA